MIDAVLNKIKESLDETCPFEIRFSHSYFPIPKNRPVIIIDVDNICTDNAQNEGNRKRFTLTADIWVRTYVPFKYGVSELRRIAAAYILPAMSGMECCITGFSEGNKRDKIPEGMHNLDIKFRIRGVYTAYMEVGL
jgi:hypothetical protein